MLLSEEAARTRWCPFAHVGVHTTTTTAAGVNRGTREDTAPYTGCLAARCMAWRWAGWRTSWGTVATAPAMQDRNGSPLGFCGLSGKPEALVDQPDHSASKPKEQP